MSYTVHSIFKTVQGEGMNAGRSAVFCRFAGCNLWSGREADRPEAVCKFCDTDFVGGAKYPDAVALADAIAAQWGLGRRFRFAVMTGGEPALQFDGALSQRLKDAGFYIAMETNGSLPIRGHVDWLTVSPKWGAELVQREANEVKLVFPQQVGPEIVRSKIAAEYYILQPMDGPDIAANMAAAAAYVKVRPWWRLGIQAHKHWGMP